MSGAMVVHRVAIAAVPSLDARAWRSAMLAERDAGSRPVTLYGDRRDDAVTLTAVLLGADRRVRLLRTTILADEGCHALTGEWPALHCFERELHEQTGLRLAGHPWLKPIRYEGRERSAMDAYPFYRVDGKEVHEVAVGPIHAGVIEPGSFRFMCHGEQVLHLEIHLGYQHRGAEARLLAGDPRRLTPLVETIAGDTSVAHAWAHCAAIEALADVAVAPEAAHARGFALELERVAMHLATLSGMAADIGFLQGATTYGRLRTTAINTTMRLCGSRFGRGALRPGGVRMRLPDDVSREVSANLALLREDLAIIDERFLASRTVRHRLAGVGVVTTAQARELGLVGVAARAAGVAVDLRDGADPGAHAQSPIAVAIETEGDCRARALVRIREMRASLDWLTRALSARPVWEGGVAAVGALAPGQFCVAAVEGWRGEVVHCLETGECGELARYKVQDPSLRNWMGLAQAVRGNEISDFPICNKSFDLSYCGNDL